MDSSPGLPALTPLGYHHAPRRPGNPPPARSEMSQITAMTTATMKSQWTVKPTPNAMIASNAKSTSNSIVWFTSSRRIRLMRTSWNGSEPRRVTAASELRTRPFWRGPLCYSPLLCSFSPWCFITVRAATYLLATLANRVDEIPLAHPRAAGDVPFLRDLVQLLPVAVLQRVTRLAAAPGALARLRLQPAPGALGQVRDRPFGARRRLRLLHISARRLNLTLGSHRTPPPRRSRRLYPERPDVVIQAIGWGTGDHGA